MKPYIGITDFTSSKEVEAMLAVFAEAFPSKKHTLMVGTMMSYKTLHGLPTKWAKAFPHHHQFRDIYRRKDPLLLNTLHYADYDGLTRPEDLARAILIAGHRGAASSPTIDALQLDMVWPVECMIRSAVAMAEDRIEESTKEENPLEDMKIILQVGSRAMELMENDPKRVAKRISEYRDTVHCVLFDRSGGLGKVMEPTLLQSYIKETKKRCKGLSIAVAGGLCSETLELIKPLIEEFPDISVDAQGKLRKSGNALDPIDWDLAEQYLRKAGELFEKK